MLTATNLFASIPETLQGELVQDIVNGSGVTIERIVSRGARSPDGFWYDQAWDEWVLLVRGSAGVVIEGQAEIVQMIPGDHLLIPAGIRHRVAWTDGQKDTIWLAVHIHSRQNL
jgi:cupin 2 domain-containing protein